MKTFDEFISDTLEEKVIKYEMAKPHTVIDPLTGRKRHLPKGKAIAVKSRSSSGGNGD